MQIVGKIDRCNAVAIVEDKGRGDGRAYKLVEMADYMQSEVTKWGDIRKATGVTLEWRLYSATASACANPEMPVLELRKCFFGNRAWHNWQN